MECTHLFDKNSTFLEGTIERIALSVKPIGVTTYGSFDGFVKSPSAALRFIFIHYDVPVSTTHS